MKGNPKYPLRDLDHAREVIGKLSSERDRAIAQRNIAQAVAFDLMFPDAKVGDLEQMKADVFNAKHELKQIAKQRDALKAKLKTVTAENKAFRDQFKLQLEGDKHYD